MNTFESIQALRRANPRRQPGFAHSVESLAVEVRAAIGAAAPTARAHPARRGRVISFSAAAASLAAAAVVAAFLTVGSPGSGHGVENATAAVRKAAAVTAVSAERSGTAVVRITRNGEVWAGSTIRWSDGDLAVSQDAPRRHEKVGSELLMVDRVLYGFEPETGEWVVLGSPSNIDPGSGTTPDEYLAAVRDDVGGATLRRFTDGMTGLATRHVADGSTVYTGTVAAGLVAGKSGFKEGRPIRVLPFGYVAHDEAADPAAALDATVTVGSDGVVREIAVTSGTSPSAWTYTVTYRSLGDTAALVAPANARPLRPQRWMSAERGRP